MAVAGSNRADEKRSGIDRREYSYNSHIPERRSSRDRRSEKRRPHGKAQNGFTADPDPGKA